MPIGKLIEGDCFFHYSQEESLKRQEEIASIVEFRSLAGLAELTPSERKSMQAAAMTPYIVVAVVRSTGERCVQRVADDRRFIMYDNSETVYLSHDRDAFLARLEENKQHRKALEREQSKMNRSRSKKANREAA